jgi:hypothetical protein
VTKRAMAYNGTVPGHELEVRRSDRVYGGRAPQLRRQGDGESDRIAGRNRAECARRRAPTSQVPYRRPLP